MVAPNLSRFEEDIGRMMERFFGRRESMFEGGLAPTFVPSINVSESENELEVSVDLPGLKPEEVNVELREGALWITGNGRRRKKRRRIWPSIGWNGDMAPSDE
jgi:HSP20 family protein